jgi:hypothetical protein
MLLLAYVVRPPSCAATAFKNEDESAEDDLPA